MRYTIDEIVEAIFQAEQVQRQQYLEAENKGMLFCPPARTRAQIMAAQSHVPAWDMRKVTTGSRRRWR